MTQNTSLAKTLLNNSQIQGVVLKNKSTQLSDQGHGLFIESVEGDRYIDLRLCSEKAYWGHSHPLMVQHKFDKLNAPTQQTDYKTISMEKFDQLVSNHTRVNFDQLDKVQGSKNKSLSKDILIQKDILKNTESTNEIKLYNAAHQYLEHYIQNSEGKNRIDQQIILNYLETHRLKSHIKLNSRYLSIAASHHQIDNFLDQGLLISKSNFLGSNIIFHLALSCTSSEILDSLDRLKSVIQR